MMRLGEGMVFSCRRDFGAWLLGQPLGVGPGFIQAEFHTTGQRLVEYERGGGLECAVQQMRGAGRLEAQGPPLWSRMRISVSSTSHRGS
jgi:hypothetical protein